MPRISSNNQNTPKVEPALDANEERNPVDVHVGNRIKLLRVSAGISVEELRAVLGVTAEKMDAYESGATRIGPNLLYEVSKLLSCPPTAFFEDMKLRNSAE